MKRDSEREVAIFTEALKVSSQEREALLERMCGGDENLRRRLEGILRAHDRRGDFLEDPIIPAMAASLLRKIATHSNRLSRKKAETSFQHRRRKRNGR